MSRTRKDVPYKYSDPESSYQFDRVYIEGHWRSIQLPGKRTKKKRSYRETTWMRTPMWWIHEMMTVPQRRQGRAWEHKVMSMAIEDLDLADTPPNSRKPHWYYW